MIPRRTLEVAAFWDQAVCLSCSALADDKDVLECPTCGERAYPADSLLALVEALDAEREEAA